MAICALHYVTRTCPTLANTSADTFPASPRPPYSPWQAELRKTFMHLSLAELARLVEYQHSLDHSKCWPSNACSSYPQVISFRVKHRLLVPCRGGEVLHMLVVILAHNPPGRRLKTTHHFPALCGQRQQAFEMHRGLQRKGLELCFSAPGALQHHMMERAPHSPINRVEFGLGKQQI